MSSTTYLAGRLRDLGARVPLDVLADLLAVASQVQRLEVMADELVGWARIDACAIPRIRRTRSTDART